MRTTATALSGVRIVEPRVFKDARGLFFEFFSAERYAEHGITAPFVQDNISRSTKGALRGLHFQHPHGQAKLVTVVSGEIFDVAVDVRTKSPTFKRWVAETLSAENCRQLFVPEGFAHGFQVLSEEAVVLYKATDYYAPESELIIRWSDPQLDIPWPMSPTSLSTRDATAPLLSELNDALLPER